MTVDVTCTAQLHISMTDVDGIPLLSPEGELDTWTASSPAWTEAVAQACADTGTGAVVLDLGRLYFMDFAGLTALENFASELAGSGRRLVLAAVRPRVREYLRYTGSSVSTEYRTVEEAIEAAAATAPAMIAAMTTTAPTTSTTPLATAA